MYKVLITLNDGTKKKLGYKDGEPLTTLYDCLQYVDEVAEGEWADNPIQRILITRG